MLSPTMKAARVVGLIAVALLALAILLQFVPGLARGADAPPMPRADAPPAPPAPPSPRPLTLKMEAPAKVEAGSGYFKVRAVCPVPVTFDVEAQFAEDVPFSAEQLDGNTELVAVPASAGVVRVSCAANLIPGQPPAIAKTFIEITAAAKKPAPPAPAPAPDPTPPPPPVKLFAVFVADAPADRRLAEDPTLLSAIRGRGDERVVLAPASPAVAAQGLTKFVADAGGAPALIVLDADGAVRKAVRLPATADAVLSLLDAAHKGE